MKSLLSAQILLGGGIFLLVASFVWPSIVGGDERGMMKWPSRMRSQLPTITMPYTREHMVVKPPTVRNPHLPKRVRILRSNSRHSIQLKLAANSAPRFAAGWASSGRPVASSSSC